MNKKVLLVLALLLAAVVLAACAPATPTPQAAAPTAATSEVEVFSWWTGGGEAAGLEAMMKVFDAQYPNITFINAAVAGGAGTNARAVLASRLQAGDPPELLAGARRSGNHRHVRGSRPD